MTTLSKTDLRMIHIRKISDAIKKAEILLHEARESGYMEYGRRLVTHLNNAMKTIEREEKLILKQIRGRELAADARKRNAKVPRKLEAPPPLDLEPFLRTFDEPKTGVDESYPGPA